MNTILNTPLPIGGIASSLPPLPSPTLGNATPIASQLTNTNIPIYNPHLTNPQLILNSLHNSTHITPTTPNTPILLLPNTNFININPISRHELKTIAFDTILDTPPSLHNLFSSEVRELIKNLVDLQTQKLSTQQFTPEINKDNALSNLLLETSSIQSNNLSSSPQATPYLNHIFTNTQDKITKSLNPDEGSGRKKAQPQWEETQKEYYYENKKRNSKSLAKTIISKLGASLESIATYLLEAGK